MTTKHDIHDEYARDAHKRFLQDDGYDPQTDENLSEGAKKLMSSVKLAPAWRDVCKAFENKRMRKRHPGWAETLKSCAIFQIEDEALLAWSLGGEELPEESTVTAPLPFPEIVVLSKNYFCAAKELWYAEEAQQAGVAILTAFTLDMFKEERVVWFYSGELVVDLTVWNVHMKDKEAAKGSNVLHVNNDTYANTLTKKGKPIPQADVPDKDFGTLIQGFGSLLAFQRHIHQSSQFLVKQTPDKMRKAMPGQIPRLYSRSRYIVVDKNNITTRFAAASPGKHRPPDPHLRRGHYRTLAANRYKEPGKRVWVRATHVKGNDVEWREGDRRYKVI